MKLYREGREVRESALVKGPVPEDIHPACGVVYDSILTGWENVHYMDEWYTPETAVVLTGTYQGPDQDDRPQRRTFVLSRADIARRAERRAKDAKEAEELAKNRARHAHAAAEQAAAEAKVVADGRVLLAQWFAPEAAALIDDRIIIVGWARSREMATRQIRDIRERQYFMACQEAGMGRYRTVAGETRPSPDGMGYRQDDDHQVWEADRIVFEKKAAILEADEAAGFVGPIAIPNRT